MGSSTGREPQPCAWPVLLCPTPAEWQGRSCSHGRVMAPAPARAVMWTTSVLLEWTFWETGEGAGEGKVLLVATTKSISLYCMRAFFPKVKDWCYPDDCIISQSFGHMQEKCFCGTENTLWWGLELLLPCLLVMNEKNTCSSEEQSTCTWLNQMLDWGSQVLFHTSN